MLDPKGGKQDDSKDKDGTEDKEDGDDVKEDGEDVMDEDEASDDDDDDELDDDTADVEGEEEGVLKAAEVKSPESGSEGSSREGSPGQLGVRSGKDVCGEGLATRIHRLIVKSILPQLHQCLTQKVGLTHCLEY